MLIAVIQIKNYLHAEQEIIQAQKQADGIELRFDFLKEIDFNIIKTIRNNCNLPVIFTLRKKSQGGFYPYNEHKRFNDILFLCKLNPEYFDIEYDTPNYFLKKIKKNHPNIKLICSYHNFHETPQDLEFIFKSLQGSFFYSYKIATIANKTLDALRMLVFVRKYHKKHTITGICMGENGQSTRILSPIIGNAMNYSCLAQTQAIETGQLTINELINIYNIQKLNNQSKIYALLGDPIHFSVGHILHNQAIHYLKENAVYIKLRVTQNELPEIISACRKLPFYGFSITMPLKETILPLLDEIDYASKSIKAINSIIMHKKKYIGFNTDGIGAIQALCQQVNIENKKIIILGAGGAARAIAYEALQQKAQVIILNRTLDKARQLANELKCESFHLEAINNLKKIDYTAIINTLPNSAYSEKYLNKLICPENLSPHIFAMDIIYHPLQTYFLSIAQKANCICIYGHNMYIYQAIRQINKWFQSSPNQLLNLKRKMHLYFDQT